jgi:hypothetical protein
MVSKSFVYEHRLVLPTINLNGNTAEDLVAKLRTVLDALRTVESAMSNASDVHHGRNFQTRADCTQLAMDARDAWAERRGTIHRMVDEITDLAVNIQSQGRG